MKKTQVSRGGLTDEEKAEIRALAKTADQAKQKLADEVMRHDNARMFLIREISQANKSLIDRINAIGRVHGIELQSGKWDFNLDEMAFKKLLG